MTERTNRRGLIVETATKLFMKYGYNGTSIRQIAEGVGCTEAAIYYHFKDGKRELLRAAIQTNLPDFERRLADCASARSIRELIEMLSVAWTQIGASIQPHIRWMVAEYPKLNAEERAIVHEKPLALYRGISAVIGQYVDDDDAASYLTWTLLCLAQGYQLFFGMLGISEIVDLTPQELAARVAPALEAMVE